MQSRPPITVAPTPPPARRPWSRLRLVAILGGIFALCCGGLLTFGVIYSQTPQYRAGQTATAGAQHAVATTQAQAAQTAAARPTVTPVPTETPEPSNTPKPSSTRRPPSATAAPATAVPTEAPTNPPTAVAQPTTQPTIRPVGCTPIYPVGSHHTCSDFKTHAQAQCFFEASGGKTGTAAGLDGNDKDGLACETLP